MFCTALNSGNNYIKFILAVFCTKREEGDLRRHPLAYHVGTHSAAEKPG